MHPVIHQRKRLLFIIFSFVLSSSLLLIVELDLVFLSYLKRPELTTHQGVITVLVSQLAN